jgi:hypothetical protein
MTRGVGWRASFASLPGTSGTGPAQTLEFADSARVSIAVQDQRFGADGRTGMAVRAALNT